MTKRERKDLRELLVRLDAAGDRLRETAREIRAGAIHPAHVANRLDKLAREIDGKSS